MAKAAPAPAAEPKKGGKGMLIIIIAVAVLVAAGGAGAAVYFLMPKPEATASADQADEGDEASADDEEAADEAPKKKKKRKKAEGPALYVSLDPAFVVNLADEDSQRYLQTNVQVMTRVPDAVEKIEANQPRIRNELMLLFSAKRGADISTREGKEALQSEARDVVGEVLDDETGEDPIEAVYFTTFVMQ